MSAPPIPCVWTGEAFVPRGNYRAIAAEHYGDGEVVTMAALEERSMASHRQFFAAVNEAFQSLPEHLVDRFPSAEALRKWALVKAGYRDERSIACASKAEAQRVAAFIKPMDEYAILTIRAAVVTVYTPVSQSMRAMGKTAFEESKTAVLNIIAAMLDVSPETLARQAA